MKQSPPLFHQFIFLILSFAFPLITFSQGTWEEMNGVGMNQPGSEVPKMREQFGGFNIGSSGYLGMGFVTTDVQPVRQYGDLNKYDPSTMNWTESAGWITDRSYPFSFSISGKGYMGGGLDYFTNIYLRDVWEYNDSTDSWTQKSDFPDSLRFLPFYFSANGKGYLGGGTSYTYYYHDFWEFDPLLNTWTRKPDVNFARRGASSFVIGTDAYVVAGYDSMSTYRHEVFKYDALNDSWSTVASYPDLIYPWSMNCGMALAGKGYIVAQTLYQYDPFTDMWSIKASPPYPSSGFPVAILNYGYMLQSDGGVMRYDPVADSWLETNRSPSHYSLSYGHYNENVVTMIDRAYSAMSYYDPSVDTWTIDSSFANTEWMFSIGDTGYAIRNYNFQKYDPSSGNWTVLNAIPFNPTGMYFAAGGKGYSLFELDSLFQYQHSRSLWEYDPLTDAWTQKSDYPGVQNTTAKTFSIADKGYLVGGVNDSTWIPTKEFWEYDPASDAWTLKANFPGWYFGQYLFATELNSSGYVGFGVDDPTSLQDGKLYRYDPFMDTWILIPTPISVRRRVTGFSLGDYLYIGLGAKRIDQTFADVYFDFWRYEDSTITAIDDMENQDMISLYPNPALANFTLSMNDPGKIDLEIYSISGQRVFSAEVEKKIIIDCSSFPSGIYFARMKTTEGERVKKFLVEK